MDDSSYRIGAPEQVPSEKVRLSDLARLAGVSVATVSRSLRNSPLIHPSTRRRVIQLANARGYVSARGDARHERDLRTSIMILMPSDSFDREGTPALPPVMTCLIEAALQLRCELLFSCVQPDEVADLDTILSLSRCDACLAVFNRPPQLALGAGRDDDRPFLVWGECGDAAGYGSLAPDYIGAGRIATAHLLARGYRRIAFVGDTAKPEEFQRFSGYVMALSEAGAGFDPALVTEPQSAVPHLERQKPDAVFAASEEAARRLCRSAEPSCPMLAWQPQPVSDPRVIGIVHYDPAAAARLLLERLIHGPATGAERLPVFLRLGEENRETAYDVRS